MILAGKKLAALKRTISTLPFFIPNLISRGTPGIQRKTIGAKT